MPSWVSARAQGLRFYHFLLPAVAAAPHHTECWDWDWVGRCTDEEQRESPDIMVMGPVGSQKKGWTMLWTSTRSVSSAPRTGPLTLVVMGQVKRCWVLCHIKMMALCCVYVFPLILR